jgi:pimeloyl-ACP methyl ester carboxylesterase
MSFSKQYELSPDTNLNVVSSGSQGATLIFLHFWGGSSDVFSPLISHLSNECRCIAVDFRGWGRSSGPQRADAYSICDLALDVEALIKRLQVKDFVLVGHSMGGKVAQLVAGRGLAQGLRGLVLIGPAPPTPLELPPDMRDVQLSAYSSTQSAEFVVRNVLSSSPLSEELVASLVNGMVDGNEFAKSAWPSYGMAEDIVAECRNIKVAVMVIGGELDKVEPLERLETEVVGNIHMAKLVTVAGSGHLIPLEVPLEVARHIKDFMNKTL